MNYRHAFHAGNFADVVKHAVLARIVEYLKQKDKAFRVIDTHAGEGLYDLSSREAQKTGEWRDGIGRLLAAPLAGEARRLARALSRRGRGRRPKRATSPAIPARPSIVRHLLRKQDRLTAIELHPQDARRLESAVCRRLSGPRHRARRLARARRPSAAQGKARAGPGRSALRGGRRVRAPGRRAAQGAPALAGRHLRAVVSAQGPQGARRPRPGAARARASRAFSISASASGPGPKASRASTAAA